MWRVSFVMASNDLRGAQKSSYPVQCLTFNVLVVIKLKFKTENRIDYS